MLQHDHAGYDTYVRTPWLETRRDGRCVQTWKCLERRGESTGSAPRAEPQRPWGAARREARASTSAVGGYGAGTGGYVGR